jgi:HEAT repeat protein
VAPYALAQESPALALTRSTQRLRRGLGCVLLACALTGSASRPSTADDSSGAMHELAESSDFRVRVNAALVLGHTRAAGAREALEGALHDGHPAVRVAAARSLGALGDSAALPALQRRLAEDDSASVIAQVRVAIAQIRRAGSEPASVDAASRRLPPGLRYLVELGVMHNRSAVKGGRGEELERALGEAARARAHAMRGTAVVEGDDPARQQAIERHIPVLTLDGNLTQVTEARVGGSIQVQVRVEFAVRRGQTLKGTVSGAATSFGQETELSSEGRRKLEEEALSAAVQSALRGAEEGLLVAAR